MARDRRHAGAESAKGGWQHPSTYATAYDAYSEIANFKSESGIRRLRYVCNHVACLHIMFSDGRLAMPTVDVRM